MAISQFDISTGMHFALYQLGKSIPAVLKIDRKRKDPEELAVWNADHVHHQSTSADSRSRKNLEHCLLEERYRMRNAVFVFCLSDSIRSVE